MVPPFEARSFPYFTCQHHMRFFKSAPQLMQPHIINMTCWPQPGNSTVEPHKALRALRSSCRSSSAFRSASKRCSSAFCRSWNGAELKFHLSGVHFGV